MNLLIVDDEIVTTQVLEEQLDRALLSIDQIYVAYNKYFYGQRYFAKKQSGTDFMRY